ncbi:MAG: hypothetical protein V3S00_05410, partial [Dehalococcoidia bacterium]
GACDALVGVKISDLGKCYLLTFEGTQVVGVRAVSENEVEDADFWLEAAYGRWQAMLESIKVNGKAGLDHTLSSIDLEEPNGLAHARERDGLALFFRYNQSFQYFFDAAARIEAVAL